MAKIPQKAQELFNELPAVVLATARADAQPNTCLVGMKKILDDETIYLSDQFFLKTLDNLKENPKVAVLWWSKEGAYVVHGTARYVTAGELFEEQSKWVNAAFEKNGAPFRAKGAAIVTVDAVYDSMPGPNAGAQIV